MNQDIDGCSGESNECGNTFSYRREKMLDEIGIKLEDESDVLDDSIMHNCNANCITTLTWGEGRILSKSVSHILQMIF